MTNKRLYHAVEPSHSLVGKIFPFRELGRRRREKIENFPSDLLKEIEDFAARNAILSVRDKNGTSYICCMDCLKAHALKKARKMKFEGARKIIDKELKFAEGHNGYYLDRGKVIKI
jgi:hypothetical protein